MSFSCRGLEFLLHVQSVGTPCPAYVSILKKMVVFFKSTYVLIYSSHLTYSIAEPFTVKARLKKQINPTTKLVHLTMLTTIIVSCASSVGVGCIRIVASTCTHQHCCAMFCFGAAIHHNRCGPFACSVDELKGALATQIFSVPHRSWYGAR